ncbi:hypothetical protein BC943DRAFT_356531 [Umbelopsis sp. AD052]|nr:hypothetical protein BC943DRAFT_356531 [Umbelopsis sp. AD052]
MDCLASQPHNARMHWSTHADDRMDEAVEQLLRIYKTRDSALPRPSHHHRTLSVDLSHGHRRGTQRASTSWLSANAGFEQQVYRVKETTHKVATKNTIDYTPPASPKQSPKARRMVTFEDQVEDQVVKNTTALPTPPASPVCENRMVSRDTTAHRQNRFFAMLHVEKPKMLSKRPR